MLSSTVRGVWPSLPPRRRLWASAVSVVRRARRRRRLRVGALIRLIKNLIQFSREEVAEFVGSLFIEVVGIVEL